MSRSTISTFQLFAAFPDEEAARTLRVSPAMAAGVTDRLWEVSDLVDLWEAEIEQG